MLVDNRLFPAAPLSQPINTRRFHMVGFYVAIWLISILGIVPQTFGQTNDNYEAERKRALQLCAEHKFVDALPMLEKLTAANPKDFVVLEQLALALLTTQATLKDDEARKQAFKRARSLAVRAKELGNDSELVRMMIEKIPADGNIPFGPARNKDMDDAIQAGEAAFAKGDFEGAIAAYQRASSLDPKLYEAPLYIGDVYYKMNQTDKAGEWYAKAIAIDPDRETAYRYWGDVLAKAGRVKEARAKLIEAIIAEPYNRSTWVGLSQWAQRTQAELSHPAINPPTSVKAEKGQTNITINSEMLGKNDGSNSWLLYSIRRASWVNDKFAKEFPNEKEYRHSLREEVEALSIVAETVSAEVKQGKLKTNALEPSLANLLKLHEAGLLEAYVLLGRPDAGIARDYEAYRQTNRDKLRQYVSEYVIHDGKK